MACPDTNELLEFREGLLAPSTAQAVSKHIASCSACAMNLELAEDDTANVLASNANLDTANAMASMLLANAPTTWLLQVGEEIDHYRIVRPLGRGGMSEVYLARDRRLGRRVALKLMHTISVEGDFAARFDREARTIAQFSHPHIVSIFDVGQHEGRPYLALEYVPGRTLRARIMKKTRAIAPEVIRIGIALVEALVEAHGRGVLHRDLKPENVVLAEDGRLRVLDFGLAKLLDVDEQQSLLEVQTTDGTLVGSPAYLAPERWRGELATRATDIWSLGVILYELVFGERPLAVANVRDIAVNTEAKAIEVPRGQAPEGLLRAIERCLDFSARARPAATEVLALLRALEGRGASVRGLDAPYRGFLPFEEAHAPLFCGRDDEVAALVERVEVTPMVAIVGPPGSGKTSFVDAGLVPRLRELERWTVVRMRPGAHPFVTLAARLAAARDTDPDEVYAPFEAYSDTAHTVIGKAERAELAGATAEELQASPQLLGLRLSDLADSTGARVLLYVDQLEELLTLVSEDQGRKFVEALCSATDDTLSLVRIVVTLNEASVSRLSAYASAFGGLGRFFALQPPTEAQLLTMLERPLETFGYQWERRELAQRIVTDVGEAAAPLALLQFAAKQLWGRRDERKKEIRTQVYEETGGVAGLVVRHAESTIDALDTARRTIAEQIFERLSAQRIVASRALIRDLHVDAERVVERLIAARLVVPRRIDARDTIVLEFVHRALADRWARATPPRAKKISRRSALVGGMLVVGLVCVAAFAIHRTNEARHLTSAEPTSSVTALAVHPSGIIAVGFRDGTIGLWRTSGGARLARVVVEGTVEELHFDSDALIVSTAEATTRWPIPPDLTR